MLDALYRVAITIKKEYKYLCEIVGMTDNDKQNMIDKSKTNKKNK